jgi:preprotein translocase subunit SecF
MIKERIGHVLIKDPVSDFQMNHDPNSQATRVDFRLNLTGPSDQETVEGALGDLLNIEKLELAPDGQSAIIIGDYIKGDAPTITETALTGKITTRIKKASDEGMNITLSDPFPLTGFIGPSVGHQLRDKAIIAIFFSLIAIVVYIRLRFKEYKYGFAAAAALVHDVLITLGAVAAARMSGLVDVEIDLPLIAAFLTIIGYSLNDTIVVFDRVRENLPRINLPFNKLINLSINQTLSRTLLTSMTTLLTVVLLFVLNYGQRNVMEGFSFALIVGVLVGTYSSIFVASPVLLLLHRREQQAAGK